MTKAATAHLTLAQQSRIRKSTKSPRQLAIYYGVPEKVIQAVRGRRIVRGRRTDDELVSEAALLW